MIRPGDPLTEVVQVDQFEGAVGFVEAAGRRRTLEVKGVCLKETVTLIICCLCHKLSWSI